MNDGDDYNIDRVGHRRWILNPPMEKTGFGWVYGSHGTYAAMYAFDNWYEPTDYYGVVWPAQNMPVEFFWQQLSMEHQHGERCGQICCESDSHKAVGSEKNGLFQKRKPMAILTWKTVIMDRKDALFSVRKI